MPVGLYYSRYQNMTVARRASTVRESVAPPSQPGSPGLPGTWFDEA